MASPSFAVSPQVAFPFPPAQEIFRSSLIGSALVDALGDFSTLRAEEVDDITRDAALRAFDKAAWAVCASGKSRTNAAVKGKALSIRRFGSVWLMKIGRVSLMRPRFNGAFLSEGCTVIAASRPVEKEEKEIPPWLRDESTWVEEAEERGGQGEESGLMTGFGDEWEDEEWEGGVRGDGVGGTRGGRGRFGGKGKGGGEKKGKGAKEMGEPKKGLPKLKKQKKMPVAASEEKEKGRTRLTADELFGTSESESEKENESLQISEEPPEKKNETQRGKPKGKVKARTKADPRKRKEEKSSLPSSSSHPAPPLPRLTADELFDSSSDDSSSPSSSPREKGKSSGGKEKAATAERGRGKGRGGRGRGRGRGAHQNTASLGETGGEIPSECNSAIQPAGVRGGRRGRGGRGASRLQGRGGKLGVGGGDEGEGEPPEGGWNAEEENETAPAVSVQTSGRPSAPKPKKKPPLSPSPPYRKRRKPNSRDDLQGSAAEIGEGGERGTGAHRKGTKEPKGRGGEGGRRGESREGRDEGARGKGLSAFGKKRPAQGGGDPGRGGGLPLSDSPFASALALFSECDALGITGSGAVSGPSGVSESADKGWSADSGAVACESQAEADVGIHFERLHTFWQNRGKDEELNAEPDTAQGSDSFEVSHTVSPDDRRIFCDKFFRILIEDSSSKLRPIAAVLKEEMTALEKENPIVDAFEAKGLRLDREQAKGKRTADDAGNIIKEKGWVWLHTIRKLKRSKEEVEYYELAQVQAVFSASGRRFTGPVARDPKHKDWTAQCLRAPMFERNAETATFKSLDFSSVPSIGSLFSPTHSIRDSSSESDSVPFDPDSKLQQQQAHMGDAVRFDKLEQIRKVKRVTMVFIPGKTNGQVWYTTFKAKADAGNLNVNEKKLLLVGHFEDPDLILWWNENSTSTTTLDEVDTLFLKAHGSTGVTQAHAVYGMVDVRLNLGDDYDKFVERFVDVYIQANPNRKRNDRISSFINALYPELREELEIEQIYTN
uniref:Uncharacterized protein n=1 Tax=Chromera velia CCMP2878 TaxID=1169474 RepID=A0A0G4HD29_9ALVE|eukprot:Cvel_26367.t1-p1 / transcript=Cvel_26367.t1 / gene=Cvel_26367 / organism=Chromera_velia_CCMP2878 / gene_product=hypothetical protein / transcript_product=hypothetical protein / location=Cvel_scaffold3124:3049-9366(+) / protein_length=1003 / sequence_SO=supercontig / SO=protein_coding / is_pseudo=false